MIQISIIEDDLTICENLKTFIGFFDDLSVASLHHSVEAFLEASALTRVRSDLLLLDIGLPGMQGLEGIRHIKEIYQELDIIMLTTYDDEEKIVQALQRGACSYLSKKTSLEKIVETIRLVHSGGSYLSPAIARKLTTFMKGNKHLTSTPTYDLTPKQQEVIQGLVDGLSYKAIAAKLEISVSTVKKHIKRIYQIMHVSNSAHAVAKYLKK